MDDFIDNTFCYELHELAIFCIEPVYVFGKLFLCRALTRTQSRVGRFAFGDVGTHTLDHIVEAAGGVVVDPAGCARIDLDHLAVGRKGRGRQRQGTDSRHRRPVRPDRRRC